MKNLGQLFAKSQSAFFCIKTHRKPMRLTMKKFVSAHMLIWIHDHFVELTDTVKLTSNSSSLNKGNHDLDGVRISDLN